MSLRAKHGNPIEIPRYARNDTSCQIASADFVSLAMTEQRVLLSRSSERHRCHPYPLAVIEYEGDALRSLWPGQFLP